MSTPSPVAATAKCSMCGGGMPSPFKECPGDKAIGPCTTGTPKFAASMAQSDLTIEQKIEEWFTYHTPTPDQIPKYAAVRSKARELADVIVANSPRCADQTAALRKLRECVMVVNQSIACRGI